MRGVLIAATETVSLSESSPSESVFDPDVAWQLNLKVAVRPEPFGALLYHFGTRKLSFLKNLTVLEIVRSLADQPTGAAAIAAAGVDNDARDPYVRALQALAESGMIIRRT